MPDSHSSSAVPPGLRPFKRGPDPRRNLDGRPKGSPDGIAARLRRALTRKAPPPMVKEAQGYGIKLPSSPSVAACLAARLVYDAVHGDLRAIEILLRFTEAKPAQAVELTGQSGGPVEVSFDDARAKLGRLIRQARDGGPEPVDPMRFPEV